MARRKQKETQEGKSRDAQNDLNVAQREKLVLDLRLQGYEFAEIAKMAGYSNASGAWKAWQRAIARIPAASAEQERKLQSMRLDELLRAYWVKAIEGDGWSMDRVLRNLERRAALLGLDVKSGDVPSAVSAYVKTIVLPQSSVPALPPGGRDDGE
jgi:hypothetical protein